MMGDDKKNKSKRGGALVEVLIVLVVLSVFAMALYRISESNFRITVAEREYASVYYVAESGINESVYRISEQVDIRSGQNMDHDEFFGAIDEYINTYVDNTEFAEFEKHFADQPRANIELSESFIVNDQTDSGFSQRTVRYVLLSVGTIGNRKREVTLSVDVSHRITTEGGYHPAFDYLLFQGGNLDLTIPNGSNVNGPVYGYKVEFQSANSEIEGDVISLTDVLLSSGTSVDGNIYAHGFYGSSGYVELRSANCNVSGDVHAAGDIFIRSGCAVSGNVYSLGNVSLFNSQNINQGVQGDVHAQKDISMQNNTNISGNSFAGGENDHIGRTAPHQTALENQNSPPVIRPQFLFSGTGNIIQPPEFSVIEPDFDNNINIPQSSGNYVIEPGVYGDLFIGGASTTVLKSGNYVFGNFDGARWGQTLRLDLSEGPINVFASGDIQFSGQVLVSENGTDWISLDDPYNEDLIRLAGKVYWETHGDLYITTNNSIRRWFGTAAVKGSITASSGSVMVGAFITKNGNIDLRSSNAVVVYAPPTESMAPGTGSGGQGGGGENVIPPEGRVVISTAVRER